MGWILPIFLVLFWQAASSLGIIQAEWLPAPLTIAHTLYELGRSGELWGHIGVTVLRVLIGFVIGAAAGTAAGALTGYSEKARRLFDSTLQALRNIPSMAWVPLFLLWLGIFEESKIALIATGVFFPGLPDPGFRDRTGGPQAVGGWRTLRAGCGKSDSQDHSSRGFAVVDHCAAQRIESRLDVCCRRGTDGRFKGPGISDV